jgi:hypothetical protein
MCISGWVVDSEMRDWVCPKLLGVVSVIGSAPNGTCGVPLSAAPPYGWGNVVR